jgi:hypothetical protein
MTAIIHLGKAVELCEELAREWEHHLAPSPDDLAVRAIARAAARLGICKAPRHSLRVVSLSGHGADEQVLGDVSDRPFRDLVGARRGSERAPFDPCLSVTILNGVRLASAVPMLGGGSLAFAIGAMRDMARVNGETVSVEPAITLTLAYDPEHVGMPQAAQLVCKIKELVERPYALLTD